MWDPTAVSDPATGTIFVFFSVAQASYNSESFLGKVPWDRDEYVVTSLDLGKTWSTPRNLTAEHAIGRQRGWCAHTFGGGHGLVLSDRLVVPGYHADCSDSSAPKSSNKCQARLDAFCNNYSANTHCLDVVTQRYGRRSLPLHARYDRSPWNPTPAWRCYSGLALSPNRSDWDANAHEPAAFCSGASPLEQILKACQGRVPGVTFSHAYISENHGVNWTISAQFAPTTAEGEFAAVVDGNPLQLVASLRVDASMDCVPDTSVAHCRRLAFSNDGGVSWTNLTDSSALPDPGCKGGITSWPAGRGKYILQRYSEVDLNVTCASCLLLFFFLLWLRPTALISANSASASARVNVTVRISTDGGTTWPGYQLISPAGGYTTVQMISTDTVGVLFEVSCIPCS